MKQVIYIKEALVSDIKIAVACHKPSILPKNKLFLPVQVGSKLAKTKLEGMEHDDAGDNISAKNPEYCELTAQYWLWKNVKADYYGLCHYRRFLAFKNPGAKRDLRNQIQATIPDQFNFDRFGLEDEDYMQKEIEKYDLIIGDAQSVPKLYTPRGIQFTAYQHWVQHDRALIMKKDLDQMLKILSQVSPKIGRAAREYLNTKEFLGFNCFIAKKDLFNELCEIEFETLSRLEKEVDLSNYHQQLTRIYGFMAEIISSSYFYYIEKSGKYKVKHIPLVYFNYTDPLQIEDKKGYVPVIFNQADNNPTLFAPIWQSFLDNINPAQKYNVFLIADLSKELEKTYQEMNTNKNVCLNVVAAKMLRDMIDERCSDRMSAIIKRKKVKHPFDKLPTVPVLPILPLLFKDINRAIVFDENIIIESDPAELWQKYGQTSNLVAAAKNVATISKVNDIYPETLELHLKKQLKNPLLFFGIAAFVWNMEKYRKKYSCKDIVKYYFWRGKTDELRHKEEMLNVLCEDDIEWIDQKWNVWFDSNAELERQLPYAPFSLYKELQKAQSAPAVVCYVDDDPFGFEYNRIYADFWKYARKTPLYENLQTFQMRFAIKNQNPKKPVVAKLFPVDGRARGKMTKILPPGSRRNEAAKKALGKLGLR